MRKTNFVSGTLTLGQRPTGNRRFYLAGQNALGLNLSTITIVTVRTLEERGLPVELSTISLLEECLKKSSELCKVTHVYKCRCP
jgi:hypothetical protein